MARGEEAQSLEKVMCARSSLFVSEKTDAWGGRGNKAPLTTQAEGYCWYQTPCTQLSVTTNN